MVVEIELLELLLSASGEGGTVKEEPMAGHCMRAIALAGAFAAASMSSARAANFDGNWTLIAQTTNGHCGVNRFDVAISSGELYYPGGSFMGFPVGMGGAVSPSGRIQVNIAAGPRVGSAAGRLGRLQGGGRWAGEGPSGICSGVWTARRVHSNAAAAASGYAAYGSAAASPGFAPRTSTTYQIAPYWSQPYWSEPYWAEPYWVEPPSFWMPYR